MSESSASFQSRSSVDRPVRAVAAGAPRPAVPATPRTRRPIPPRSARAATRPGPGCARRSRRSTISGPRRTTEGRVKEQWAGSSALLTQTRPPHRRRTRSVDLRIVGGGDDQPVPGHLARPVGTLLPRHAVRAHAPRRRPTGATHVHRAPQASSPSTLRARHRTRRRRPGTDGRRRTRFTGYCGPSTGISLADGPSRPSGRRSAAAARPLLVEAQDLQLDRQVDLAQRHVGRERSARSGAKLRIDVRPPPPAGRPRPGPRRRAWR